MSTMKVGGSFHNVGLPDEPLPPIKAQQLMPGQYSIGMSLHNRYWHKHF